MSEIVLIGMNHNTAPVELRECIALSEDDAVHALQSLKQQREIDEVLVFSTCNRVEFLMVGTEPDRSIQAAKSFMTEYSGTTADRLDGLLYVHIGDQAVKHVFRVAASLDSMVVGEPQILGQIKSAYRLATQLGTSGVILNRLLHRTFFVAKRIRTETGIGDHAVSISFAAIELGRKIFGSLAERKTLLIGAGEMAELAIEHLIKHQVGQIWVANRTFARGMELAEQFNGRAIHLNEIDECLKSVDIIISSTGSPDYVIRRQQVKDVMRHRRNRPIFFIDIAVPRDIDPDIHRMPNAYLYDIDDLKGVVDDNIEDRQREALKGERIVDEAVVQFHHWLQSLEVVPTIKALRHKFERIAEKEIHKTIHAGDFSEENSRAVQRMVHALVNKILHDPTVALKRNGCQGHNSVSIATMRRLFNLDKDETFHSDS